PCFALWIQVLAGVCGATTGQGLRNTLVRLVYAPIAVGEAPRQRSNATTVRESQAAQRFSSGVRLSVPGPLLSMEVSPLIAPENPSNAIRCRTCHAPHQQRTGAPLFDL